MSAHRQTLLAVQPALLPAAASDGTGPAPTAAIGTLLATKKGLRPDLIAVQTRAGQVRPTGFADNSLAGPRAAETDLAVRDVADSTWPARQHAAFEAGAREVNHLRAPTKSSANVNNDEPLAAAQGSFT